MKPHVVNKSGHRNRPVCVRLGGRPAVFSKRPEEAPNQGCWQTSLALRRRARGSWHPRGPLVTVVAPSTGGPDVAQ